MKILVIGLLALLLTGCVTTGSVGPTSIVCAPLVEFPSDQQKAAAAELKKLPQNDPLRKMAVAFVKQRDVVRACKANNGGGR